MSDIVGSEPNFVNLLDFSDESDFDNARRGLVAELDPPTVTAADGRVVWDIGSYGFLAEDCPPTRIRVCGGRVSCAISRGCSR
ncbi:hypothetical protein [Nocardia sp. CC216A]|uniref:hypothetical protein n=1 Tax=unclassified Nocardia TaxID=2637762 RepID=UPI003556F290